MQGKEIIPFDKIDEEEHKFFFLKVKYEKNLPIICPQELSLFNDEYEKQKYIAFKSFGFKSEKWRHENEFRLIANSNSKKGGILPLEAYCNFLKVTEVILGKSISSKRKNEVISLCKDHNIKISQATCSKEQYSILKQELNL